jgi:small subunit ribosomal protein S15
MLTDRVNQLTVHLKINKSDHASRRGLLLMISKRKRLLAYIKREELSRYEALIARLGIRG